LKLVFTSTLSEIVFCLSGASSVFSGEFVPLNPLELFVLERFPALTADTIDVFLSVALIIDENPLFKVIAVFFDFSAWLPRRLLLVS
jgi:hypothetical protein